MSLSIAILSDVHGNSWALEAVLADVKRRGIQRIVNLGDSVFGSGNARRCVDLLMKHCEISLMGNCDRYLVKPDATMQKNADVQRIRQELSETHLRWLSACPFDAVVADEIFCCHATPQHDDVCLLEDVTPAGVFLADAKAIRAKLRRVNAPVICVGHSHIPRAVQLPNGQLIMNPGSVGWPAYNHDQPHPHVMEVGSPHARYAVLHKLKSGWAVEHIALPYDWHAAAVAARQLKRPDRARWIETGRAQLPAK
jgi:putative phosphoesterase